MSSLVTVPCPCLLCQGKLVTPHVRRKHISRFNNAATNNDAYNDGLHHAATRSFTEFVCADATVTVEAMTVSHSNLISAEHVIERGMICISIPIAIVCAWLGFAEKSQISCEAVSISTPSIVMGHTVCNSDDSSTATDGEDILQPAT